MELGALQYQVQTHMKVLLINNFNCKDSRYFDFKVSIIRKYKSIFML